MSKLIRAFSTFCDENGYPGTIDWKGEYDGGDTAAILGTLRTLYPIEIPLYDIPSFASSIPARHPDLNKWYGQPDRFSRDQLIPAICGIINSTKGFNSNF